MDSVVGSERLPDFEDRAHLPFLNATIKETLRYLCFPIILNDFVKVGLLGGMYRYH